jgi:hypothetical protein
MALTSPKMGLRVWDQLSDPYDHSQLADNWSKVDFHDHTPGRGLQIPTEGIADGAVTGAKLAAAIDPSPVYTTYKHIANNYNGFITLATAAGNYMLTPSGTLGTVNATGTGMTTYAFYIDPTDWAVAGRITNFRIRAHCLTGNQAPGSTFTISLAPIQTIGYNTSGPYVGALGASLGTVTFTTPVANATLTSLGAEFTLTAGFYGLVLNNSASTGGSSYNSVKASVLMRQV